MAILYLDIDGVLHPDAVYRGKRGLELRAPGHLLMHASILISAIGRYPDLQIVLSTSWVRELGYDKTLSKLPLDIKERVIGATWHKGMRQLGYDPFSFMPRHEQITRHAKRSGIRKWLAVDDLHSGSESWPDDLKDRLILCDGTKGLGDPETAKELNQKLSEIQNDN